MAVVNPLTNSIELLEQFGFFQVMLPILLVFAIFYGVLLKTEMFGKNTDDKARQISSVVAFASAFFVVASTDVVDAINVLLPQASLLLVLAVLFLLMIQLFIPKYEFGEKSKAPWIVAVIILLIFLGILNNALELQIPLIHQATQAMLGQSAGSGTTLDSETTSTLLGLLMVIGLPMVIIWLMVRKSS